MCYQSELNRFIRYGIPAGVLVYLFLSLEPLFKKSPTLIKISSYGDTSYTTYLLHTFIVPAVPILLIYLGLTSKSFALISCLVITFIASYFAYHFFEKRLISFIK